MTYRNIAYRIISSPHYSDRQRLRRKFTMFAVTRAFLIDCTMPESHSLFPTILSPYSCRRRSSLMVFPYSLAPSWGYCDTEDVRNQLRAQSTSVQSRNAFCRWTPSLGPTKFCLLLIGARISLSTSDLALFPVKLQVFPLKWEFVANDCKPFRTVHWCSLFMVQ